MSAPAIAVGAPLGAFLCSLALATAQSPPFTANAPLATTCLPRAAAVLDANRDVVARQVTENILERHLRPLFGAAVPA
jgi:hypothetical protein